MERRTFVLSFSLCCMCLLLIAGCGHSKDPVITKAEKMPYDFKLPTWLPFQPESKKVQHDDHFTVIYKKRDQKVYLDIFQTFNKKLSSIGRKPDVTLKNGQKAALQDNNTELLWIEDNVEYFIELEGTVKKHKPKQTLMKIANSFKDTDKIKTSP